MREQLARAMVEPSLAAQLLAETAKPSRPVQLLASMVGPSLGAQLLAALPGAGQQRGAMRSQDYAAEARAMIARQLALGANATAQSRQ